MISKPGLFAIDINGQMDDQDTGRLPGKQQVTVIKNIIKYYLTAGSLGNHSISYYKGPPIHTVTVFANPFLPNKPSLEDPGVHVVFPGEEAPSEGAWHTLYFSPGLHDLGANFQLHANRSYSGGDKTSVKT